jgi:hypothetical protein
MRTTATNRKIRVLVTALRNGTLIPRPEFQRRLVWSNKHKVAFLDTVLRGYPFPEIYVAAGSVDADTGEGTEMLVDGQQRMTTLYQYFIGSTELRLGSGLTPYADLEHDQKVAFLEYDVVVRDLGQLAIPEIKEVFTRINSTNYALNAMEIQNARYEGAFKDFGETMARHPFFEQHRIFGPADIRRMHDLRFVLTLTATMMSTYFHRDDELDEYLERFADSFPAQDKVYGELNRIFSFVDDCGFPEQSRVWRKPDLFSLLVELHRALIKERMPLQSVAVQEELESFFRNLNGSKSSVGADETLLMYLNASIQGVNDRGNRLIRGEIIHDLLDKSLARASQLTL